jgi:hypothetical protein
MTDNPAFTSFAPGFEFLQGLVKNAGAALPGMGQWVAPTLDPEELDKRIQELKTVQFWLEQNARMLGATIQALEVQKMTLTTLQTMNVQMGDLREALTIRMPTAAAAHGAAGSAMPPQTEAPEPTPAAAPEASAAADTAADSAAPQADSKPAVDPMQWWGALTKQFSELAANALKDGAAEAAALVASAATVVPAAKPANVPKKSSPTPPASHSAAKKATGRSARSGTAAPKGAARKAAARAPR